MGPLPVTSVYAALLALLFIRLSMATIRARRQARVPLGDGDDPMLRKAMRAHGNFAEYTPLGILLLAMVELAGAWPVVVHAIGLALLAGRAIHAYGVSAEKETYRYRVTGMVLTLWSLGGSALLILGFTAATLARSLAG